MRDDAINVVRREQTQHELAMLRVAIEDWLDHRRDSDVDRQGAYAGRHETQLKAIGDLLTEAGDALNAALDALDLQNEPGEFYAARRRHDRTIVWLRKRG